MLLSIQKAIQKVPLYIHIILLLIGMLNYSIPFILETNQVYDEIVYQFSSLIEKNNLVEIEEFQHQTDTFGIYFNQANIGSEAQNYVLFQEDGVTLYFDGTTIQQSHSEDVTGQEFLTSFLDIMFQMRTANILMGLLKSILYVSFISLAFILVVQYISRRYIKFKYAFKHLTIPVIFGSFSMILMNNITSVTTNILFVVSFVITSCLYGLLCSSELKKAMTGDFLGEGRVGYDIY